MSDRCNAEFGAKAKVVLFAILCVCLLLLLYFSLQVILISLIGIGIAVIAAPLLTFAKKRLKIPRAMTALLYLLVIAGVIAGSGFGVWYLVSDQVHSLSGRLPEIISNLQRRLSEYPRLENQLGSLNLGAAARGFLSTFFRGIVTGFSALSGFVLALVISLYAAVAMNDYFAAVVRAFPQEHREKAARVLGRCATALRLWFRAQLLDMLILGIITGIGLWIAGVEYWAVYGLLTATFAIIPYLGILIVVVCAALITWASDPSQVVWVLAVFFVTQQVEGNLILPMLMKGQVELPEVPLLIFMLLLGGLLGILGVLLAPPLFAVIRVLYIELYLPRVDNNGA